MIESINNIASAWWSMFVVMLVQNTLFLALVLMALHLTRHGKPAVRFSIALIGLLKLIVPPFLNFDVGSNSLGRTTALILDQPAVFAAHGIALSVDLSFYLLLMWAGGVFWYLGRFVLSTWRLHHLLASSRLLDLDFDYPVYQSDHIAVPLSAGLFSPRIYVPDSWNYLPAAQQRMVLHHEAEHIRRLDHLFLLLQTGIQSLYFFHPLVWMLNKHTYEIREMICDDAAVFRSSASPLDYSRLLLQFAQSCVDRYQHAAAFQLLRPKLLPRISYQLEKENYQRVRTGLFYLILLLVTTVPFSWTAPRLHKNAGHFVSTAQTAENKRPVIPAMVDYDTPPLPAGGLAALRKHLVYPESAREEGIEGRAVLAIQINHEGAITRITIEESSGNDSCDRAAIDAVRSVKWHPAKKDNHPVNVTIRLPFVFNLK
ncbi:TonB family protein [candidate division KSB1 bacterium]|nr:TonB family protein [candidate division KSB1 bacterium]